VLLGEMGQKVHDCPEGGTAQGTLRVVLANPGTADIRGPGTASERDPVAACDARTPFGQGVSLLPVPSRVAVEPEGEGRGVGHRP
jgi:hypothetical protein